VDRVNEGKENPPLDKRREAYMNGDHGKPPCEQ